MAALIEAVRFGFGPRADQTLDDGPPDPARLLAQLQAPEDVGLASSSAERLDLLRRAKADIDAVKHTGVPADTANTRAARTLLPGDQRGWIMAPVSALQGFRERLVYFWLNRMTVAYRGNDAQFFLLPYRDEVIRPHVGGRFADMLAASAWHPAMNLYLEQAFSSGPNSAFGRRRKAGLNENYAREFLELHSMGGKGYTQADVTELARLFTGMTYSRKDGVSFVPGRAEPGTKTVLGDSYGSGVDEIARLIATVARRPETAASLSHALARHFLRPDPPADLVARMAEAYLQSDTALVPVYRVMLDHPAAADPVLSNVRSPVEYVAASLRALGSPETGKLKLGEHLRRMGQPVFRPTGPDGWHEAPDTWISGPAIAGRLRWAEMLARGYGQGVDPRQLAPRMLGAAHADTIRAVGQAEQRWEGVAVLLASPDFMRR
ncbi:MAG: DUF1800 domain-containing protein [Paracoccaceae bacterium]